MNADSGEDRVARKVAATGVAGVVLIVGGSVVAVIARLIEPPFSLTRIFSTGYEAYSTRREITAKGEDFFGRFSDVRLEDVSAHFANTALIAAAAALAALVVAWFVGRGKRDSYHGTGGVAVLLIFAPFGYLMVDLMTHHLPGIHTYVRDEYPYYAQWPLTVAAYGLVAAGILLVAALAVLPGSLRSLTRRGLVLSLVAGLLVTSLAGTAAAWFGDDTANIEHRTAAPAEIPPPPATLGTQRYALTTDELTADGRPDDIVLAGTGFVLASASGLTAYDGATGEPRWHYRRTNVGAEHPLAYSPGSLRSLDGGAVVAATWGWWGRKVFDAVTGELLRDAEFGSADDDREHRVPSATKYRPGMVIFERDGVLERYDARTNELLWSSERLLPGCVRGPSSAAATARAVFVVAGCAGETNTVRIVAVDARTGAVAATRDIAHGIDSGDAEYAGVRLVDNHAVVEWLGDRPGKLVVGAPGDLAGATELDRISGDPIATDPHGAEVFDGAEVLDIASGAVKATYPPVAEPAGVYEAGREGEATAVFLTSELAQLHRADRALALRALPRSTAAPSTVPPFVEAGNCGSPILLPAPGAVLVFCPRAPADGPGLFGFAA